MIPRRLKLLAFFLGIALPGPGIPAFSDSILLGGYWDTRLQAGEDGTMTLLALPSGQPGSLQLYYLGVGTGIFLRDDGAQGDFSPGDGVWGFSTPMDFSGSGPLSILLEIGGPGVEPFPYLNILGPPTETPSPTNPPIPTQTPSSSPSPTGTAPPTHTPTSSGFTPTLTPSPQPTFTANGTNTPTPAFSPTITPTSFPPCEAPVLTCPILTSGTIAPSGGDWARYSCLASSEARPSEEKIFPLQHFGGNLTIEFTAINEYAEVFLLSDCDWNQCIEFLPAFQTVVTRTFPAPAGKYFLAVDSDGMAAVDFQLLVTCGAPTLTPTPSGAPSFTPSVTPTITPTLNPCGLVVQNCPLDVTGLIPGSGGTWTTYQCHNTLTLPGEEDVFALDYPGGGIQFSLEVTSGRASAIMLFDCDPSRCEEWINASPGNPASHTSLISQATTLYIVVDNPDSTLASYHLQVSCPIGTLPPTPTRTPTPFPSPTTIPTFTPWPTSTRVPTSTPTRTPTMTPTAAPCAFIGSGSCVSQQFDATGATRTGSPGITTYGCDPGTNRDGEEDIYLLTHPGGTMNFIFHPYFGPLDMFVLGSCDGSDCLYRLYGNDTVVTGSTTLPAGDYYLVFDRTGESSTSYSIVVSCGT